MGARTEEATDVRLISATHRNLRQMVDEGRFRQDLFYRLNVLELRMPSLRECRESIPQLAQTLLERIAAADGKKPELTRAAVDALCAYPFPGNVRELENCIKRATIMADGSQIMVPSSVQTRRPLQTEPTSIARGLFGQSRCLWPCLPHFPQ